MSASASSSASSKGGEQAGGNTGFNEGDWNIATGSGQNGISQSTILIIAAGMGVLWLLSRKK